MYPGKNDMPCSNTLAEIEYDGGGSLTEYQETIADETRRSLAVDLLEYNDDPMFIWEALTDGKQFYNKDSEIPKLLMKGDDESLLKMGRILRESAIEYATGFVTDDVWETAMNEEPGF